MTLTREFLARKHLCGHCCMRVGRRFWYAQKGTAMAACSLACLNRMGTGMNDPDENEIAALEHAGAMGGEYLDEIGETDLAKLTVEQWMTLVEAIVTGYQDRLRERVPDAADDTR